jgi:tetratricopeptide (TPR) repeat protein
MARRRRFLAESKKEAVTSAHADGVEHTSITSTREKFPDHWQTALTIAFHFLFLTLPLVFTWVNEELFEFNKMILVYAVTIIIASLWVSRMIMRNRIFFRRTPFDWFILLFLISQVCSTLFSLDTRTSLFGYYTRFNGGLFSTLSYIVLFYAFVSNIKKSQLRQFFLTIFTSAFLVTLMAIPEHFGHSFSCLLINTTHEHLSAPLFSGEWFDKIYNVSCWIQDVQTRVFASFGQPNWLAAYAITLIPIGISLTGEKNEQRSLRGTIQTIFFGVITILLFITLLFTKSRSGIAGLAAGLIVYALGYCVFQFLSKHLFSLASWVRNVLFVFAFLIMVIIFGTPYTPNLVEKLWQAPPASPTGTIEQPTTPAADAAGNRLEIGGTDSGEIRKIVWTGALKIWLRYPIFGSGVETFAYSYYRDRPVEHNLVSEWDFLYNKAHNEFLNYLATTGLIGFLSYSVLVGVGIAIPLCFEFPFFANKMPAFLKKFCLNLKNQSQNAHDQLFSLACSAGLIGLAISNFFGFSTVVVSLFFFLLPAFFTVTATQEIFLKLANDTNSDYQSTNAAFSQPTLWQISSIVVLVFLAAGLLFKVSTLWFADYAYAQGKQEVAGGKVSEGLDDLQKAIALSPSEGLFSDELGSTYSTVAVSLAHAGNATAAGQLAGQAMKESTTALQLNPANLNFYKTNARILMNLSPYQPSLLYQAKDALIHAIQLSPTDPKLRYFLGAAEAELGENDLAIRDLEQTVALKPNYGAARLTLAEEYLALGRKDDAISQYQYILLNLQPGDMSVEEKLKAAQTASNSAANSTPRPPHQ